MKKILPIALLFIALFAKGGLAVQAENQYVLVDENFSSWTKQGATSDLTLYSETKVYGDFTGTFYFQCSAVDDKGNIDCSKRRITINPSTKANSGWLIFPELPNVAKITINRDYKAGAAMRIDKFSDEVEFNTETMADNLNWEAVEADEVGDESEACMEYTYTYTSRTPVQLRITSVGSNAGSISRLYIEGYGTTVGIDASSKSSNPVYKRGDYIISEQPVTKIEVFNMSGIKIKETTEQYLAVNDLLSGIYSVRYFLEDGNSGFIKVYR